MRPDWDDRDLHEYFVKECWLYCGIASAKYTKEGEVKMTEEEFKKLAKVVPDLEPPAQKELSEYIKAMNVMLTMRHQDNDDFDRFWMAQVVDFVDPVLLHIMSNLPEAHRVAATMHSVDNAIVSFASPYAFDLIEEYKDAFNSIDGVNIDTSVLVGGKGEK